MITAKRQNRVSRPQLSIRLMLAGILFACVLFAALGLIYRFRRAVIMLRHNRHEVVLSNEIAPSSTPTWMWCLRYNMGMEKVIAIRLKEPNLAHHPELVVALKTLGTVEVCSLESSEVARDMTHLLRVLNISHAVLKPLSQRDIPFELSGDIAKLEIDATACKPSQVLLNAIRDNGKFVELTLRGTNIGDEHVPMFVTFSQLNVLLLVETKISDQGLALFSGLQNLTKVGVAGGCVTGKAFCTFPSDSNIVRVSLSLGAKTNIELLGDQFVHQKSESLIDTCCLSHLRSLKEYEFSARELHNDESSLRVLK